MLESPPPLTRFHQDYKISPRLSLNIEIVIRTVIFFRVSFFFPESLVSNDFSNNCESTRQR